jgi:predicted CopG family antitoxin
MSVKTVTLAEEAYQSLAAAKREGESFSQVVRRLTGSNVRLSDFVGAWKGAPKRELARIRRFLHASDELSKMQLESLVGSK